MIITLSRQYMAGGSEVAARVAKELGWEVIDDGFVEAVAARSGYTIEDVRNLEERVPTFLERFAQSSALSFPEFLLSAPSAIDEPEAMKLAHVTRDFLEDLKRRTRVVLVGRAAAAVLSREKNVLHARLVAPVAQRTLEAMRALDLDEAAAAADVEEHDTNRERYHREFYDRDWDDPVNYHMVLNTELLTREGAADLIVHHARALGW
ncbi:MAG: AAA family ATPase [Myxococcota bacterium]